MKVVRALKLHSFATTLTHFSNYISRNTTKSNPIQKTFHMVQKYSFGKHENGGKLLTPFYIFRREALMSLTISSHFVYKHFPFKSLHFARAFALSLAVLSSCCLVPYDPSFSLIFSLANIDFLRSDLREEFFFTNHQTVKRFQSKLTASLQTASLWCSLRCEELIQLVVIDQEIEPHQ